MRRSPTLSAIKELNKRIFTTGQLSTISGRSLSAVTQSLNSLTNDGIISKIYRGIWAREGAGAIGSYDIIPYLFPKHRAYVSFISALHLHGIIEQIPQVTTLASTAHGRIISTKVGVFRVHRINPSFFAGFDWYKENGSFLIAEPEKALVDSLYLSAYKKKYFGHFPELHLPKDFSIRKVRAWVSRIASRNVRTYVAKRVEEVLATGKSA